MAKCLVGAAGGGKVTVSGLSSAVVKQGTTVTVKQGEKTVTSVKGTLIPFGSNRFVSYYVGDTSGGGLTVWVHAKTDGTIVHGWKFSVTTATAMTIDFDGTVSVNLASGNRCQINGVEKTGTFSVKKGDVLQWRGTGGSAWMIQLS